MDVDDLRWNNYFSEAENRNHFILSTHENHFRKIQGRRISPKKAYQFAPLQICLRKHYSM
jgi:hypothetical protein